MDYGNVGLWMIFGISVGSALGAGIGAGIDNVPLGISTGIAMGSGIGVSLWIITSSGAKDDDTGAHAEEPPGDD